MKRLVLTLFLLAFALGVNAFLGGRVGFDFEQGSALPPRIISSQTNGCIGEFRITSTTPGTLTFFIYKNDPNNPSAWDFVLSTGSRTISGLLDGT
jgi:hypothetical protein